MYNGNCTINNIKNNCTIIANEKKLIIDFGISKKTVSFKHIKCLTNNKNNIEIKLNNKDIILIETKDKDKLYDNINTGILKENKPPFDKKKKLIISSIGLVFIIVLLSLFLITNHSTSLKEAKLSVLKINVYNKSGEIIQSGSGFVIFKKNILVTNAHVITNGYSAEAINENDERVFIQGAIYYNQDEDIAILKLNNQNSIKPLKIANNYSVGDKVIAIGSPLGIKNSVSDGMISNIYDKDSGYMIQHSAPISSGSSGGVLLNKNNKVIGMNTASFIDGQNINLSIPISTIKKAYEKSKNNKVKKINKIQLNDDELIQSVMLNNNAGKQIIELIKKETNGNIFYSNKFKDYKNTWYFSDIYSSYNGYISQFLRIFGTEEAEDIISDVIIFKLNDNNNEVISLIEDALTKGSQWEYSWIYEPEETFMGGKNSNSYFQSYKNASIGQYNNYIYMIAAKSDSFKEKLIKLIEQLPN